MLLRKILKKKLDVYKLKFDAWMELVSIRVLPLFEFLENSKAAQVVIKYGEQGFTIFAFLFFSRVLELESLFKASEGEGVVASGSTPLTSIASLLQHGIFLVSLVLIVVHWKWAFKAVLRNKFILILILLVLASFQWSSAPSRTYSRSLAFLETCTFGVYLASKYTLKEQLRLLFYALGTIGVFSLIFSLALPSRALEMGVHAGAWRGPFIQKNLFARMMVFGSAICLCLSHNSRRERYIIWSVFSLLFGLVVMSTSRTALGLALLFVVLRHFYQIFRWQDTVVIPILLTVCLGIGSILTTAIDLFASGTISLSGRLTIWSALLDKIQMRPWLGYGYVGFWDGIYGESAYVGKVYGTTYIPPHSHNGFLELIIALGVVGATLFGLSFISIARRAIISARLTSSSEGLWPLIYLSFIVFYNQTESTLLEHNSIFWVTYVSLALSQFISNQEWAKHPLNRTNKSLPKYRST